MNLNFRDVIARNVVRSNIAQLNVVAEKFYAGKIDLLASIDTRAATPAVSAEAELSNVSIGSVLKDFNDMDFISGEGNLNLNVRSLAQTNQQLMKSMNGLVSFSFTDGEVTGINIAEQLRRVEAITKGEQYVQSREVNSTDFAAINGGGSIRNGVYTWTSLNLQAPLLRATAKGNIDIGEQTFATDFDAYFVNTKSGQAGKNIDDVRSLRVPVRLGGTFGEPKLSVAPNFLRSIGGKVEEVIEEKKEQISNAVSEATQAQRDAAAAKLAEQKAQLDAQRAAAAAKLKAAQDAAKEKAKEDAKNSLLEKLR